MTIALEQVFAEALGLDIGSVSDELAYNSIPQWDSVAHMGLIAQLEDNYGVLLDTDDIIDMSSVGKARELLAKYGVAF
ncbi:acyl carrier protein [Aeromonas sp. 602293]|uniref:acyl carrier protein n=1 Tax=unclassified Aeromonas TaxID=257493 RepID=UPI0038E35A82